VKLRVRHNSIRFRLAQSDMRDLRNFGKCRETILFPGGARLEYVLSAASAEEISVGFANSVVSISVPASELRKWHSSDQIGISATVDVHPGKTLEVLVEKDFKCLDASIVEDQSDMFENPLAHLTC
jgi:hypothetical protein